MKVTCYSLIIAVLGGGALLSSTVLPLAYQTSRAEMLKKSNVVFVGTVTKMGAVSFPGVSSSPRTMVVRVDSVLEKPPSVSLVPGASVTIEVRDPSRFREGAQATFYTQTWVFGQGLALREIGHELMPPTRATAPAGPAGPAPQPVNEKRTQVEEARRALNDAELRARVQAAEIVAVGQVEEVRAPTVAAPTERPQAREHDPEWREAVVRVQTAIKGAKANDSVVVKFPASRDVAWYQAPKFQQGQSATFILRRDQISGVNRAMLNGRQVTTYTALTPADVLPPDAAERIRALLR